MPPLRPETKAAREQAKLIEKMKALGIDESVIKAALEAGRVEINQEALSLEAEAVLAYVKLKGKGFTKQECPHCKGIFAYKYSLTKGLGLHCSDDCRKAALKQIGINWDPTKPPEQRFLMQDQTFGPLLLTVPPAALKAADAIIDREET